MTGRLARTRLRHEDTCDETVVGSLCSRTVHTWRKTQIPMKKQNLFHLRNAQALGQSEPRIGLWVVPAMSRQNREF